VISRGTSRKRRQGGQALLEFALVLPIFMVALLGMIDLGRVIWANDSLTNAAREAARYAIVHGGSRSTACPVGPPAQGTIIPVSSPTCLFPSPSKEGIREAARAFTIAGGSELTVQVCYGTGCAGDVDAAGATNARGTPVTVTVSSKVPMIVGTLIGLGTFDVLAQSTMLVNH
jgi:hypothetical protein